MQARTESLNPTNVTFVTGHYKDKTVSAAEWFGGSVVFIIWYLYAAFNYYSDYIWASHSLLVIVIKWCSIGVVCLSPITVPLMLMAGSRLSFKYLLPYFRTKAGVVVSRVVSAVAVLLFWHYVYVYFVAALLLFFGYILGNFGDFSKMD
ncbi:MAG: hypothetical protein ABJA67_07060 [Chthonomonadales bacterium]